MKQKELLVVLVVVLLTIPTVVMAVPTTDLTGSEWVSDTGGRVGFIARGTGDSITASGRFAGIKEFNVNDGSLMNTYGNGSRWYNEGNKLDSGAYYAMNESEGVIEKIDRSTGDVVWSTQFTSEGRQFDVDNGRIYAGEFNPVSGDGWFYSIDDTDGSVTEIRNDTAGTNPFTAFKVDDDRSQVWVTRSSTSGDLYLYDIPGDTFTEVNTDTHSYAGSQLRIGHNPVNGSVYIAGGQPKIDVIAADGTDLGDITAPNDNHDLFFATYENGFVYARASNSSASGTTQIYKWAVDNRTLVARFETASGGSTAFETDFGDLYVGNNTDLIKAGTVDPGAGPEPPETNLTLEIRRWMPRNDTQPYKVILNETNTTTGNTNLTDVTGVANVTVANTSLAVANESANRIESQNLVGRTNVTADYQGTNSTAVNLTVGPRNLSNIGIMPPEEWPCSFLGCDDAAGGHNIGSDVQWLWLIIVIMVAATRFAENPFVGVGTGIVFSILVWVLEYIDLGSVLITVFSGLLIGALMARTQMGRGVTRDNEEAARISASGKDQP